MKRNESEFGPQAGKKWAAEFSEFLEVDEVVPPQALSKQVKAAVGAELFPSVTRVLMKLSVLHVFAGGLSLLACSQFGMGRTTVLTHSFMRFGDIPCMAFCGALFIGATGFVAGLVLNAAELNVIRKQMYLPLIVLQVISLAVFLAFGAEIAVAFGLAWMAGGFLSGVGFAELARKLRRQMAMA